MILKELAVWWDVAGGAKVEPGGVPVLLGLRVGWAGWTCGVAGTERGSRPGRDKFRPARTC